MSLSRSDPFSEMTSLRQAMDRLFDESFVGRSSSQGTGGGMVPLDLLERDDAIVVKASLPGVKPEDVDVSVHRNILTIAGRTAGERDEREGQYRHRERWHGSFSRQISLPAEVDTGACDATFQDGVLTVTLPKSEQSRAKRITVSGDRAAIEGGRSMSPETTASSGQPSTQSGSAQPT